MPTAPTTLELGACRACGKPASRSAVACPTCGAIRPTTSADDFADEIALAKAKSFQTYGGIALFTAMGFVAVLGKEIGITVPLLVMGAGLIMVIAGRIDTNAVKRRKSRRTPT